MEKNIYITSVSQRCGSYTTSVKLLSFKVGAMNKFRSCYNKCVKLFFAYRRADSVTTMLRELRLPTFDSIQAATALRAVTA